MGFLKHKFGILVFLLCLGLLVATVWYCLFGLPDRGGMMDGTLVKGLDTVELVVNL